MTKPLFIYVLMILFSSVSYAQEKNFHSFTVKSIDGEDFALSRLAGKKVLVVNVASKCGLTGQYEGLQKLYGKYKDSGLVIVGFPANNFAGQEPGSNEEIKAFCTENYGVTFPMMEKISVKGDDTHPLYQWLTQKELNGVEDNEVEWNFKKYLIDEEGKLVKSLHPTVGPMDEKIIEWIEQ